MDTIFVLIVLGIIFNGTIKTIIKHRERMAEFGTPKNVNRSSGQPNEDIRDSLAQLRDTTTRFDMSFDQALQRLEDRMNHMEARLRKTEQERENQQVGRI